MSYDIIYHIAFVNHQLFTEVAMVTKTHGRLHFEDLDPLRFEDLCLSVVYRYRRWEKLDHLGRLGSDGGKDICAYEKLENGKIDLHVFQCKRYSKLNKTQLRKIVSDYCANNVDRPDYYYLVAGCDLSKDQIDCFNEACSKNGIGNAIVWSASVLEAILYGQYHDLLFAFFGVNMTEKRNNKINSIRRNVALKKQMHADFLKQARNFTTEERKRLFSNPALKFNKSEVLIRSIYDTNYPKNTLLEENGTGYFKAEVYDFYHNGLMVRSYPYCIDARVRFKQLGNEQNVEKDVRLETIHCIPFENIIAYDMEGDEYYPYPHLYCDFINGSDPFEEVRYWLNNMMWIDPEDIIEKL